MDRYANITWKMEDYDETHFLNTDNIRHQSATYKILHNQFFVPPDSSDDECEDNQSDLHMEKEEKETETRELKKTQKKISPQEDDTTLHSSLSYKKYNILWSALVEMKEKSHPSPVYTALEEELKNDQLTCLAHLREVWEKSFDKHNSLVDEANKFIIESWKHKLKRVYSYPQFYKLNKMVPLVNPSRGVVMKSEFVLMEMGVVPNFISSCEKPGYSINTEFSKMMMLDKSFVSYPDTLHKIPVSQDKNAEHLALHCGADIVISSSSLLCLANNVPSKCDRMWTIPVTIKEYCVHNKYSTNFHKVVYIDKVLPPKDMTRLEKNSLFHKKAVKLQLCNARSDQSFTYPDNTDFYETCESLSEHLKSFVVPKPVSPSAVAVGLCTECKSYLKLQTKQNETKITSEEDYSGSNCDSDAESDKLLIIDTDNESSFPETPKHKSSKEKEKSEPGSCKCGKHLRFAHKGKNPILFVDIDECKNEYKRIPPPSESNVTYRLWNLNNEKSCKEDLKKKLLKSQSTSKEIKLLVRSKMDACESETGNKSPLCISTKMEHQVEYGAEKLTLPHLIKEWTALFIRPEARLQRIRIDAANEQVMMTEKLTIHDVLQQALSLYDYNIKINVVASFHIVFSSLASLEPGHYILSHNPGNGAFISVFQHTEGDHSFDLYSEYKNVRPDIDTSDCTTQEWTPIDVNVLTPAHISLKKIPATFPPLPEPVQKQSQKAKKKSKQRKRKRELKNLQH